MRKLLIKEMSAFICFCKRKQNKKAEEKVSFISLSLTFSFYYNLFFVNNFFCIVFVVVVVIFLFISFN